MWMIVVCCTSVLMIVLMFMFVGSMAVGVSLFKLVVRRMLMLMLGIRQNHLELRGGQGTLFHMRSFQPIAFQVQLAQFALQHG